MAVTTSYTKKNKKYNIMAKKETKKATPKAKTTKAKIKPEVASKVEQVIALDLGCGQNKVNKDVLNQSMNVNVDKVIGVDWASVEGVDVVHDLTQFPYPFADNSVDVIYTSHFIEHLDGKLRAKFMDECYRMLKVGGKVRHIHPYAYSHRAIQDFTHAWPPICEHSYFYFDRNWREQNKLTHGDYDLKSDFDFQIYYSWADQIWPNKSEEARNFATKHYKDVIADLIVDMQKRAPGIVYAKPQ
jgi:hypothetical protein